MKHFYIFCVLLIAGNTFLQSADIADNHTQFIQTLQLFIKNKKRAALDHIKKAQQSFLACSTLIQQGKLTSQDTGFYYLQTTIDKELKTSKTKMSLSTSFYPTYTELLGFDDNIEAETEPKSSKKVSPDFYKNFPFENRTIMQNLFLRRVFSQFKISYRGTPKSGKQNKLYAEKIQKIKNATEAVLMYLESDYHAISKQKRFSERPTRRKSTEDLSKSKSC